MVVSHNSSLKTISPFKAWLLWDADGTYESTLHHTRACAESEKRDNPYRDAKWRIMRVEVRPL
jgi:hypothetical protein